MFCTDLFNLALKIIKYWVENLLANKLVALFNLTHKHTHVRDNLVITLCGWLEIDNILLIARDIDMLISLLSKKYIY